MTHGNLLKLNEVRVMRFRQSRIRLSSAQALLTGQIAPTTTTNTVRTKCSTAVSSRSKVWASKTTTGRIRIYLVEYFFSDLVLAYHTFRTIQVYSDKRRYYTIHIRSGRSRELVSLSMPVSGRISATAFRPSQSSSRLHAFAAYVH